MSVVRTFDGGPQHGVTVRHTKNLRSGTQFEFMYYASALEMILYAFLFALDILGSGICTGHG
jgi:hypothetical protein